MEWDECLKGDVASATKNTETAKALLKLCDARLEVAKGIDIEKYPALLAEAYYEVIKELITALLAAHGFKSYSHLCLIAFVKEYYASEFPAHDLELMDKLRKIRNDVGYRGIFTGWDFLGRNEKRILSVISRLRKLVEKKIGEG